MINRQIRWLAVIQAILLSWTPGLSTALSTDRNQPMLIEADEAELDDANGISIYRGDVKVTQGTLTLTGDVMTVHSKGNDINKVIIDGSPATYAQLPDNKEEFVRARSTRMEYYTTPDRVVLLGEAEVWQAGDLLKSERIEYNIETDQVNAGSQKSTGRVKITLQPKPRKELPARPEPAPEQPAPPPATAPATSDQAPVKPETEPATPEPAESVPETPAPASDNGGDTAE